MCGIAGQAAFAGRVEIEPTRAMLAKLHRRGPDEAQLLVEDRIALGVTGLRIADPDGVGQPFDLARGGITAIANGEIYNRAELVDLLTDKGVRLATGSDMEVLPHLYQLYGQDFVRRVRGMFSFAILDRAEQVLLLGRDRMGEKPLYYHLDTDGLVFASEMKALLASGAVEPTLSPLAVDQYLHFGYVPEPRTAVADVEKLDAGCLLRVDLARGSAHTSRYWSLDDLPEVPSEPTSTIRHRLNELAPLVADTSQPAGVALGGGLGATTVAHLVRPHLRGEVAALNVSYAESDDRTDLDTARRTAHELGMELVPITVGEEIVVDRFLATVRDGDDPIAEVTAAGAAELARVAAERGIRVVFSGYGADELFGRYHWTAAGLARAHRRLGPSPASRLSGLGAEAPFYDLEPGFRTARAVRGELYGPRMRSHRSSTAAEAAYATTRFQGDLDVHYTKLIADLYLREHGLAQADRLSMAHSVEMRHPFVDQVVAETVIGLRKHRSDRDLPSMHWLRESVAGLVPDRTRRQRRRPAKAPIGLWERGLRHTYGGLLREGHLVADGIVEPAGIANALTEPTGDGTAGPSMAFKLLVLEAWCQTVLLVEPTVDAESVDRIALIDRRTEIAASSA